MKLHRDELVEENQKLTEANRRYRMHTTELKDRMESLMVSIYNTTTSQSSIVPQFNRN